MGLSGAPCHAVPDRGICVLLAGLGGERVKQRARCDLAADLPLPPQPELRPRLCTMKRGANGYGFNLHSDKSKPGQFIRAVDPDSPAEASGLRAQDRIVEVMPSLSSPNFQALPPDL